MTSRYYIGFIYVLDRFYIGIILYQASNEIRTNYEERVDKGGARIEATRTSDQSDILLRICKKTKKDISRTKTNNSNYFEVAIISAEIQ